MVNGILPENFVSLTDGHAFVPIGIRPGAQVKTETGDVIGYDSGLWVYARIAPGITPRLAEQMLSAGTSGVYTNAVVPPPRLKVLPLVDGIVARSRPIVFAAWAMCA